MTMPKQSEIEQPLLTVLRVLGGQAAPKDVYARLEQFFEGLTEADKAEQLTSGVSRWRNRVQFARQNLVMQGLIDPGERGQWKLTAAGALRAPSSESEAAALMPAVVLTQPPDGDDTALMLGADTDPIFAQRNAHEELQRQQLFARLRALSWREFEHLTGRILHACGLDDVVVTQGSRDGGIDGHGTVLTGIIRLRVAFQCKLQTNRIDRAEIDKFRGAIQGEFEQGIFVTTSEFTAGAKQCSYKRGTVRIQLIDGDELVRKMFDNGIGVSRHEFYLFKQTAFPSG